MSSTFATEDNEPNPGWDAENTVVCPACNGTGDIPTDSGCNDCCELCCGEGRVDRWVAEKYGSAGDREVLKARPTVASENSKYYVGGTTVYGPRVHGHQKDRVESASIAQATQPPGTWADDGIDAIKLLSDALNVKDTTGKTPRELAGEVERLTTERDQARKAILSYGNGADFDWNVLGRIDDLERERDELVKVLGPLYAIARIKWGNLDPDANTILADAESLLARVNQPAAVTEGAE